MVWNDGVAHECKILELELNKKLSLSWPTNGWGGAPLVNTVVKFSFIPTEAEHTLLEMEHSGFGTGDSWIRYYGATYSGWTYYLLNLKSVLENGIDLRDEVSEFVHDPSEQKDKEPDKELEEGDKIEV